jgi:hypothetical protein
VSKDTNWRTGAVEKAARKDAPAPAAPGMSVGDARTSPDAPPPDDPGKPDPFDPASLRLPQDFAAASGVKKLLTTVPVRKPAKESFVQTHPDEGYRLTAAVLELKEEREIYLVPPALLEQLAGEPTVSPRLLVTTITRQGVLSLWPLRLPGPDGRLDDWGRSALEAAEAAKKRWVRVAANMSAGCYDVFAASEALSPPEWPQTPFNELLRTAFKDKFIDSLDHPVLRKLRGEE